MDFSHALIIKKRGDEAMGDEQALVSL